MNRRASLFGEDARMLSHRDFQVLLFANVVGYLGVALISPLLSSLTGPFGVSPERVVLMVSAFTAPAIVLIPLGGVLADRYGRKPMLLAGLLSFGTGGVCIAMTTRFDLVLLLRVVQGLGFAALVPTLITTIGDLYTGTENVTAQGLRVASSGISQMVFPVLAGLLVGIAWQYPFFLYGMAFPMALAVLLWLDEPDRSVPPSRVSGGGFSLAGFADLMRTAFGPRMLPLMVVRFLPPVGWIGFLTYNSIIVTGLLGGTPSEAGVLVAVGSFVYAGAASQVGRVTELVGGQQPLLLAVFALIGLGLAGTITAPSLPVVAACVAVLGMGFGFGITIPRSLMTEMAPDDSRGSLVGVLEGVGRVSGTVVPIVMSAIVVLLEPYVGYLDAVRWMGVVMGASVVVFGSLATIALGQVGSD